ncbi:unnamed protein product [Adineta steineri]|uniref:NACHT domain-containing protein n=1 Tax=Adineta steineri TaxID=433720 RepID=A0A815SEJ9_9BILA|nr:unnamed protein product [Adineta steineri]
MSENRFVNHSLSELHEANRSPIFGYEDSPILTLEDSVEKLTPFVPRIKDYVMTAKNKCNQHSDLLTKDESAAIYLYSMASSFFSSLNTALRAENRHALKPWFAYLKLLMTALKTLPSIKAVVWRGVYVGESYINLAIVETKKQQQKEKQLRDACTSDAIMGSFEEIYGTKTTIDVKNIFETCKNQEKKVLVFGRAGIGKSTFCRYITYQWAIGSYWPEYELLALIPLRRLTADRYPPLSNGQNYSLIDLVKKEIFSYNLSESEDKLLKKHFDAKKTLWILDGYDELVQNIPSHLECLFEQLLKTPHHILTSRPYQNALAYHVQMEITGFTDKNIERYVKQFFEQIKDELDNSLNRSQKLFTFLQANPSIWGVAHIPVNLELICSLWSNEEFIETKELTITSLYTEMVEWLCRRYLSVPNKKIQNISKDDVNQRCEKELAFLENLAFNGMKSSTIILRPNLLRKALNEENVSLHNHPHILNMGILKSFKKQGIDTQIETDKDHYFVHLSFQEYFAGRYLIKALKDSSTHQEEIKFIQREKYNQRYALVFTFLSGLSSEDDANTCLDIFWELILTPPIDLFGIRHMQLVISCIEETSSQSTIPQHTLLIEWIVECIHYNLFTGNQIIRDCLAQSLRRAPSVVSNQRIINVLIHLLKNDESKIRIAVLSFISEMNSSNLPVALINLVAIALEDKNERIRRSACEALGNMGEKAATNEVITKLVSALEDEKGSVVESAYDALEKMGEKAAINEVITKLVSALQDESDNVIKSACEALGKMGEKAATNEAITKLVDALEDERGNVVASAYEALEKMGEKAATNEVITKLVDALKDERGSVVASAREALEKMGEKAAKNEELNREISALEDQSQLVRWNECQDLGNIGEKATTNEVLDKLVNALEDKRQWVRKSACQDLGNMGEKSATSKVITKLVSILEDESKWVRKSACEALGNIGEKLAENEELNKLISELEDESDSVGAGAFKSIGDMGEKAVMNEAITKLVGVLEDESESEVRWSAFEALIKMGEKAATNEEINTMVSTLEHESQWVKRSACQALGNMGEKAAINEVIIKLVSILEDESKWVRKSACEALGKIGEKLATNEVLNKVVSISEDESQWVRWNACEDLVNMGEKAVMNEAITKLVDLLEDESELDVRWSASEALIKMGEKAATIEVITKLMNIRDADGQLSFDAAYAIDGILWYSMSVCLFTLTE